ncbi:hypothetical protein ACIBF1_03890 [Spirillospora sp. NPDC050679]
MPADPPGPDDPTAPSRHGAAQRRLLAAATGLVVLVLAAGVFVASYDALRDVAVAGGVGRRWSPAYPVMADALVVIVVLALIVARHARWWSRAVRWTLLAALLAGGAALGVQHAVWGFGSLPDDRVKAGVAVAPHAMLILAVWLWLTMFKQLRAPHPRPALGHAREPGAEGAERAAASDAVPVQDAEAVTERVPLPAADSGKAAAAERAQTPAQESDTVQERDAEREPVTEPLQHAPEPSVNGSSAAAAEDAPQRDRKDAGKGDADHADDTVPVKAAEADDPPPALLPGDVELVHRSTAARSDRVAPDTDDDLDAPAVDRAEDPDAGDDEEHASRGRHRLRRRSRAAGPDASASEVTDPNGFTPPDDDDLPIWDWNPPSGSFRSSPTPPAE